MYFAAPEQTSLPPLFTKKSDIYSLGKILLFMITGEFKFAAGAEYISVASQVKHDLSNGVDALIKRMLSFAPQQRPAEITEIIKAIDALLGNKNGQKPGAFKPSQLQHRALKYIYSNNTPALVQLNGDNFLFCNKSLGDLNVEKFMHKHPRSVDGVNDVWYAYPHSSRNLHDIGIARKLDWRLYKRLF
jgi:serine/threonine protein kinase